jgi:hypothetical protein
MQTFSLSRMSATPAFALERTQIAEIALAPRRALRGDRIVATDHVNDDAVPVDVHPSLQGWRGAGRRLRVGCRRT